MKSPRGPTWNLTGAIELHRLVVEDYDQLERRSDELNAAISLYQFINSTCTVDNWGYKEVSQPPLSLLPQVTPLWLAIRFAALDSALLLLSKGADPNKAARREDGDVFTPLHEAAWRGSTEVCRSLLASGAMQDIGGGILC